jgi:acyl-coenzyme A synthetase/AMP-(fatty) acid ligase
VVGLPDPRLGEVPVAAVELREGAEAPPEAALIDAVRNAISPQAAPVRVVFLNRLPRTGSLKIDRAALTRLLAGTV